MNNIKLVDEKICTGCGACYNICPKKAISMQPNDEGFLYPVINNDECVDCGLCLKSCAAYNPQYKNSKEPECYAVWANDEIRMKSSSGGAFTLLANYVLDKGGYVCGAAWDKNFNVEHVIVHNKEDLDKLRYSKYVQSNTKKTFTELKKYLDSGKYVLFTGTPCQVAGFNKYLGKKYENLLTADIVCHGVPSQKIWQDFLKELPYKNKIKSVNFRPKKDGWGVFKLTFYLNDGSEVKLERNNAYFAGFERALFYRKSCGTCPFNHMPRQGDITLADFWGIEFYDKPLRHPKGTSCVMINSKKGEIIFKEISRNAQLVKKKNIEESTKYNRCFYAPTQINEAKRKRFFDLRKTQNFSKSVDFALNDKYDVGIVGIWFFENYGAILTAYALYKLLESMGYTSILVDSSGLVNEEHLNDPHILSRRFMRRFKAPITSIKRSKKELSVLNSLIDNFVLASDQLWHYPKPFGKTFFLDFAHDDKRKISIATSFGDGYVDPKSEWGEAKFHMHRLDRVSVREADGVDICKNIFGVKAEHILDPVFLCDFAEYEKVIEKAKVKSDEPYLLSYILDTTEEKENIIKSTAEELGLKLVNICDGNVLMKKEKAQKGVEVEDWLYYFKNAEAVITDSFHGTCFAMIFNKPFVSIVNQVRGTSRFTSLLSIFKEEKRMFFDVTGILSHMDLLEKFDKNKFSSILSKQKEKALRWIKEALTFPKNTSVSTYDLLANREVQNILPTNTETNNQVLRLLLCKDEINRKYFRYKILRKIYFGKMRKHYKEKYKKYKEYRKQIKSYIKGVKL